MIRVRVGIVVWNTADLLNRCLAALPSALDGVAASIVVVDNNSADGSADVASRFPSVTLIRNEVNVGYARAMNQALAGDDVDVLIALNPDTEPPPSSLAVLAERMLASPDVGLMAPRLIGQDGQTQHSVYRFPSVAVAAAVCLVPVRWQRGPIGRRFWLEGFSQHNQSEDIEWVIGAVHVLRPAAIGGLGPYNERWFMYVEDLDLCWQLAQRGWRRRFEADIEVHHVGNAAGALAWGSLRMERWQWATYDWYLMRHGRRALRVYAAVNAFGCVVVLLRLAVRAVLGRGLDRSLVHTLRRAMPIHRYVLATGTVPRRPLWTEPPSEDAPSHSSGPE